MVLKLNRDKFILPVVRRHIRPKDCDDTGDMVMAVVCMVSLMTMPLNKVTIVTVIVVQTRILK
jgi:hypothetical protein